MSTIDYRLKNALSDLRVKKDLLRLSRNEKKYKFFKFLISQRRIDDEISQNEVTDWVRDSIAYANRVSEKDIDKEIEFFKHRPDRRDMKRQSYNVYISPKKD